MEVARRLASNTELSRRERLAELYRTVKVRLESGSSAVSAHQSAEDEELELHANHAADDEDAAEEAEDADSEAQKSNAAAAAAAAAADPIRTIVVPDSARPPPDPPPSAAASAAAGGDLAVHHGLPLPAVQLAVALGNRPFGGADLSPAQMELAGSAHTIVVKLNFLSLKQRALVVRSDLSLDKI